jgi:hypothetical protein
MLKYAQKRSLFIRKESRELELYSLIETETVPGSEKKANTTANKVIAHRGLFRSWRARLDSRYRSSDWSSLCVGHVA